MAEVMERAVPTARPRVEVADRREMIRVLEPAVAANLGLLTPVEKAWQPSDCLPDLGSDGWPDEVADFRQRARSLPDDLLVVLVGDMITEEALPSYSVALNGVVRDDTGDSPAPWARWLRGWSAEENRHGDLLNGYLRLTGRVDMRAVERTIHALIANGFNPGGLCDPYNLLVYTSFQERATRISHANVGRLAGRAGDPHLARICGMIASDEARHETFYSRMMGEVLDRDPAGGILAIRSMLRATIAMPGRLMDDGGAPGLFDRFAIVAQRTGVYTVRDYASIIDHLVRVWGIADRRVSGEAARAQEEVCRQAERHSRLADRISATLARQPASTFSWIHGRPA
jgi:acyl-[acyl-carrier-protein] desaturase